SMIFSLALWALQVGTTPALCADPPLTLPTAIQEASDRNPQIQRAEAAQDEASWRKLEALSGNIPHLSINANHLFTVKYQTIQLPQSRGSTPPPALFDAVYPKTILSLQASWTFFDGFQTWDSFVAAKKSQRAAERELERARFQTESEVTLRFY